jgi:hypothetical protein
MAGPSKVDRVALIQVDTKYGGLYAGTSFEISEAVAAHFNAAARDARGVLPGEFRAFGAGECFSIACPTVELSRPVFIAAYQRLRARIDDDTEIVLSDYPRLYSTGLTDSDVIRGVPTYIPKSVMPPAFFGRAHTVELYQGEARIFGPVERFFHTPTSGVVFDQIEDGHGRLVVEIRGNLAPLAERGQVVFFTDPAFGEPTGVVQVGAEGAAAAIEWRPLGWDRVGDTTLFLEWVAVEIRPTDRSVVLEISFPKSGVGLATALFSGHTRDTAFRVDATVLPG